MRKFRLSLLLAGVCLISAAPAIAADASYDLVLRNARIVDGTGNPWYRGDIALRGDTIVRIAPAIDGPATRVIDLKGLVVTPGFIDIHTHFSRNFLELPTADNYVRQGVTAILEGADGGGSSIGGFARLPIKAFFDKLEATPKSINVASFIGQGAVREAVIGLADRKATPEELARMQTLVRESMDSGAFGLSTGLFYVPGAYTPQDEVVELQKVVAPYRGVHTSHMRDEAGGVVNSVQETIAIGELGGVPTHVSHHKMMGKANWGKSVDTLALIDAARARGIDVTLDAYPYTASATSIQAALLPKWALEGGLKQTRERLKDPAIRARMKADIINIIGTERGDGDPKNVVVSQCSWNNSLAGKNLAELTQMRGLELSIPNAAETTMWLVENGGCGGVFHAISEDDVKRVLAHPATMIASDGGVQIVGRDVPHPRSYGTFARVLGVYVREQHLLTLEDAVRKMTSFPAQRLGLEDRGILRPGMKADIAVFDPAVVKDMATFDAPHQYAVGFAYVLVNGQVVFENGAMTSARSGRVLYGPGKH